MDIFSLAALAVTCVFLLLLKRAQGSNINRDQISGEVDHSDRQPTTLSTTTRTVLETQTINDQSGSILVEASAKNDGDTSESLTMKREDMSADEEHEELHSENDDAERAVSLSDDDSEKLDSSPIHLLEDVGGLLKFQNGNLEKLLDPEILGDRPVAIIAIAGALRMGKSFLLNMLLRYLKKKGWESKNGEWLHGWTSDSPGIQWSGGSVAHTRGIVAWGKPIIIEQYNKKEIAVILLDTQGNFEHGRNPKENAAVFALSTLFSSLQIFNVNKQIQTNDLDYLQCFVEFAKTMMPTDDVGQTDVDRGDKETYEGQFQDLAYMVRDWPHPDDFKYGEKGGKKYLDKFMSIKTGTKSQCDVQMYLKKTFHDISCFLMPEPGKNIRISKRDGPAATYEDLGEDFAWNLTMFANKYLHPHAIKAKLIGRCQCTDPDDLKWYMKTCANALANNDVLEIPKLIELVAERASTMAMNKAEKSFFRNMKQTIENMDKPTWREFDSKILDEENSVKNDYLRETQYGKDIRGNEGLTQLQEKLNLRKWELESQMQCLRKTYIESEAKKWLVESDQMFKGRRGYFLTSEDDFTKIKKERLSLLIKKDERDSHDVAEILPNIKVKLEAKANEAKRSADEDNSNKTWYAVKAVGGAAVAGAAIGVGAVATGALAIAATPAIVVGAAAGILPGGIILKMKLDSLWNKFWSKKKQD